MIKKGRMWSLSRDNPLWAFMQEGIPSAMVVTTRDSKKQVDEELKAACEEFIGATVRDATDPVASFLVKAAAFKVKNDKQEEKASLAAQPFAQPEQVKGLVDLLAKQLEKVLPPTLAHVRRYLNDRDTEEVLFRSMKTGIVASYKQFYDLVRASYDTRLVAQMWSSHDVKKRLDLLSPLTAAASAGGDQISSTTTSPSLKASGLIAGGDSPDRSTTSSPVTPAPPQDPPVPGKGNLQ